MRTIREVVTEIQSSLTGLRVRAGESMTIEIWTLDGYLVHDAGKGVKITIPFKSISDTVESEQTTTRPARKPRRVSGMAV